MAMDLLGRTLDPSRRPRRGRSVVARVEGLERRSLLAATLTPIPATFNLVAGVPPSSPVRVGSFLDSDPRAKASDFAATIIWSDGHVSAGTVSGPPASPTPPPSGSGPFDVTGTNLYFAPSTYPVDVQVSDYQGDATTIHSTAYVTAPPLSASGLTFSATSGQPFTATVATVTYTNPAAISQPSLLSATISWGDGQTSQGTVSLASSTGSVGTFSVTGTHTYAAPGVADSYPVMVTITEPSGQTATARSTAIVAPPSPPAGTTPILTGNLDAAASNGPHSARGFTNTNQPTFSGTAPPYSTVQLFARHFNVDAQLPLGEAVADGDGHWTFTSGPLAVGVYIISATATAPGGYPSDLIPLKNSKGKQLVYIDLTPALVQWLSNGQSATPRHQKPHNPHWPRMMHAPHPTGPQPSIRASRPIRNLPGDPQGPG